jgi:serine/threonine protein kinase
VPSETKVCPTCQTAYPDEYVVCPRDGASLSSPSPVEDALVGATLGGTFQLVRVLGEGGMGRVYEAHHARIPARRFAVKVLNPEYALDPEWLARFLREGEAVATITNDHVVFVHDVDRTPDGRPFLVAELLEGRELAEHLSRNGKMAVGDAVRIVRQICKGLAAAHAKGIVHRDMKPENVFLTGDMARPIAKIIDFGISKVDSPKDTPLTRSGMILGTPSYMSPEQAGGLEVDLRADIYAVGAILYVALTGRKPFDHKNVASILLKVVTEEPPRPRSLAPAIPEPVEAILLRTMAKNPDDRYQSMTELDAALSPYDGDGQAAAGASDDRPGGVAPAIVVGLGAYGLGTLLVRFLEAFGIRIAGDMAWPVADVFPALLGLAAASIHYLSRRNRLTASSARNRPTS